MTLVTCILGAALVVSSPTNAPASFSTEAEQTFAVPDITERNVRLDCGVDFVATASNRIEIAIGLDIDGDGVLDDSEAPFTFAVDCGRLVLRDGKGDELFAASDFDGVARLSLLPAKGGMADGWRFNNTNGVLVASGLFTEGTASLPTWNLARVRMSGPTAAAASVRLKKNRHAMVFTIR